MKECIIKNKKYPLLAIQLFNSKEFGCMGENIDVVAEGKDDFFCDNEEWAYRLLQLLKEADKRGCFDNVKEKDKEDDKESGELIYI